MSTLCSAATKYYHQDHLSNRIVTDSTGTVVAQMGHYPYGESWYNSTNDKLLFTSYERDSESGNDYAMARYDVSRFGRFLAPDQYSGNLLDPQSLNRYTYVENDPCNNIDPLGLQPCTFIIGASMNLSDATKAKISAIFNAAGVNVAFVGAAEQSDVNLINVPMGPGTLGNDGWTSASKTALIDLGQIQSIANKLFKNSDMAASANDQAVGVISSHEMGHYLLNQGHSPFGIMQAGNVNFTGPFYPEVLSNQSFTTDQQEQLRQKCAELHPPQPGPGDGNAAMGGGGPLGGIGFNTNCQTIDFSFGWITQCDDGSGCGFFIGIAGGCSGGGGGGGGVGGGGGGGCDIFDVSCGRGMGGLPPKSVL